MRLLAFILLPLPLALGEKLQIPFVQSAIASQLAKFSKYTSYDGPTGTAAAALAVTQAAVPKVKVNAVIAQAAVAVTTSYPYWYETITHQGVAAFNTNTTYTVFRNVKSYGAKGDGVTDDTAAINKAISDGNRCAPGSCASSTTSPAVVYFPAGTYLISSSILDYYYTQLIGNPNAMPVLKATAGFTGLGVIDGDQYEPGNAAGVLSYGATSVFWRQIRNFIIDLTAIPSSSAATGIHWPTAQATSLQNIVFQMSSNQGTQHQGVFIEGGSGGFMNDLIFYGGLNGVVFGNQQFTVRNLTFYNSVTAISQIWNWGWTYKSISVNNCSIGIDMTNGNANPLTVGSVTLLDSSFTSTAVAILTDRVGGTSSPATADSLVIENVALSKTPIAVKLGTSGATLLAGTTGSLTIAGWGSGNTYNPAGPTTTQGNFAAPTRPASLLVGSKYYERSKPQYNNLPVTSFNSVRTGGAKGDGVTDDTIALQNTITAAAAAGQVVFVDAGTYKVTKTILIPKGCKMVGETYSVIMSSGAFFSNINSPQAVVQVGNAGDTGIVEWSDMIISTQGPQAGAILIQWNLASTSASPSGMWDVHTRIGGFAGSNLQLANCPTTPSSTVINDNCLGAYMSMHIAKTAAALYMENVWLWTADHDVEDPNLTQITVYTGRGLYIESTAGTFWLVGTAVEHHARYQYQLQSTTNIFMGQIQTETPCCSVQKANPQCQSDIFTYDTAATTNLYVYNLNTIGSTAMITKDAGKLATNIYNYNVYPSTIYFFRTN
ncbi:hypothetical protein P7C71_g259, partial [Lecanoromycetidae sp. Uapishka_2]